MPSLPTMTQAIALRAQDQRWPVADCHRKKCVEEAEQLLNTGNASDRKAAIEFFIKMDRLNLQNVEIHLKAAPQIHIHGTMDPNSVLESVQAKLQELGVDPSSISSLPRLPAPTP